MKGQKKLSPSQLSMLESVRDTGDPWARIFGQAAHGGAAGTIASLQKRALLKHDGTKWALTPEGTAALKVEQLVRKGRYP